MQCPILALISDSHRGFNDCVAGSGELVDLAVEYSFRQDNVNDVDLAGPEACVAHCSAKQLPFRMVSFQSPFMATLLMLLAGVVV